ncbi:MAG: hypothetical protein CML13_19320 [Puniceicoccaceae bacterium]|nr:hypothetical protein [Puniceicoccaceae bacterium]
MQLEAGTMAILIQQHCFKNQHFNYHNQEKDKDQLLNLIKTLNYTTMVQNTLLLLMFLNQVQVLVI